jgi:chorismate mutase/prephenate dehydratase
MAAMIESAHLLERIRTPEEIVATVPWNDYQAHYQPGYKEKTALLDVVRGLQRMEAITEPEQIENLRRRLAAIALGNCDECIVIEGACAEPICAKLPAKDLARQVIARRDIVRDSALGSRALHIQRGRGQSVKPRTHHSELLADGQSVVAYMGDGVNGNALDDREPDATRMVAMAAQARQVELSLKATLGQHMPAAHEALLLPYEMSAMATDAATGKRYLLSADLPWIGVRTNAANGVHVALLRDVENPVGVKIGDDSTYEHIAQLVAILDPNDAPGKLLFMLRLTSGNETTLASLLESIKTHAPHAMILYDIHGVTRMVAGVKVRVVSEIAAGIEHLAATCQEHGLRLHGMHLETMSDDDHRECVDALGDAPTRLGCVDPQLNPRQLRHVLDVTAHCFPPAQRGTGARAAEQHSRISDGKQQPANSAAMGHIRRQFDDIDSRIIGLLMERAELAIAMKSAKGNAMVYRPAREAQILRSVAAQTTGALSPEAMQAIYSEIIGACRNVQSRLRVAYLGPAGSYSHEAAQKKLGSASEYVAAASLTEAARLVEAGTCNVALLPIENSAEGAVAETHKLLLTTSLQIVGETILLIRHCLLSKERRLDTITRVYAHPQALGQCREWLRSYLPQAELIAQSSNSRAAEIASGEPGAAAIASQHAAKLTGLAVLAQAINDSPTNETRFVLLGTQPTEASGNDKTSIICSVENRPGALYMLLGIFAARQINLVRLVSQPISSHEYVFFVDLDGHQSHAPVAEALSILTSTAKCCTVLGSYPKALGDANVSP